MDRQFLTYYEAELAHIRELAGEFAALHPNAARNLSLETVPCPDPYVERLLEGVAYLAARTRLKIDAESTRLVRNLLDALYPDLVAPAPAMSTVVLAPGAQVQTMPEGHVVKAGTRLVAGFREGLATRATYTTCQDVALWPIALGGADYLQDRGALAAAGFGDAQVKGAEAALRLTLQRQGTGALSELALDRLDINFAGGAHGGAIFDALHGHTIGVLVRPQRKGAVARRIAAPTMVGLADSEALLPRVRPAFEGYRLLREYFLMPERFHYARLAGLNPALRETAAGEALEIVFLLERPRGALADISAREFRLFCTPVVNLFEKECNIVELDPRAAAHVVYPDRTRPRDYEVYRLLRVEDADREGAGAELRSLYSTGQALGSGIVYTTERRPRRAGDDEIRQGQMRTSYAGDDFLISVARLPAAEGGARIGRLDIRALCTNRDLPVLDDTPKLTLESGDPVASVDLAGAMHRPRPSLAAALPQMARGGETHLDDLAWRLIGQLSLNHLSLAEADRGAEPLRALLELYADRGDPALSRHARAITGLRARTVTERLPIAGPICFGKGVEITLDIDDTPLSGGSTLLLSAILNQLFARYGGINSFVRTRARLTQRQEEVSWPIAPGIRPPI